MRRIFVIALANFAVVGLVLVAAIGNIASACSASEGCGGAPPLAWFGIGLALVAALGVFVAMRRWARATRDTESVKVGSFARGKSAEVDPPTISGEEIESRSRNRLGRITNTAQADDAEKTMDAEAAGHDAPVIGDMLDDYDTPAPLRADEPLADGAAHAPAQPNDDMTTWPHAELPAPDGEHQQADFDVGSRATTAVDDAEDDDLPFVTPWQHNAEPVDVVDHHGDHRDESDAVDDGGFDLPGFGPAHHAPHADTIDDTPPINLSYDASDDEPAPAMPEVEATMDADAPSSTFAAAADFRFTTPPFAELAPSGFPATMRELSLLVDAIRDSVTLDEEGVADVAAWSAVIAPFASEVPVSEDDRAAFASWADALFARTGADLALPIESVLYAARMPRLDGRATGRRSGHSAAA